MALDSDDQVIGYEFIKIGPMLENINKGMDPAEALKKATGTYGRYAEGVKFINPRHE